MIKKKLYEPKCVSEIPGYPGFPKFPALPHVCWDNFSAFEFSISRFTISLISLNIIDWDNR